MNEVVLALLSSTLVTNVYDRFPTEAVADYDAMRANGNYAVYLTKQVPVANPQEKWTVTEIKEVSSIAYKSTNAFQVSTSVPVFTNTVSKTEQHFLLSTNWVAAPETPYSNSNFCAWVTSAQVISLYDVSLSAPEWLKVVPDHTNSYNPTNTYIVTTGWQPVVTSSNDGVSFITFKPLK